MAIPLLSSACGCLSLETGTKVIGWLQLVGIFAGALVISVMLSDAAVEQMIEDREGINVHEVKEFATTLKVILWGLLLIYFAAVVFLLLGTYQKRPGYMKFWLVLAVISTIASILSLLSLKLQGIGQFIINLYCTWVVYSHYKELQEHPEPSAPGEVLMYDGVPHVVTHNPPLYPDLQGK